MYARTISAALVPGKADEAISIFHDKIVPMIQGQPGYVRTTLLVNRESNQAMTVSVWESKEAASATAEGSNYLKQAIGMLSGVVVPKSYQQWEVGSSDRQS